MTSPSTVAFSIANASEIICCGSCTLRWHLRRHITQRTIHELVHPARIQCTSTKAITNKTDTAAHLADAVTANPVVAATAAMMAAEQRPVRAGMRARHRPDEVRR